MRASVILLAHSLKRVRILVASMGLILVLFQVFVVLIAKSIQGSNAFEQMGALIPPFARDLLGPAMTSFMSFRGIVCMGYFHLAVMSALIALSITLATMPTSEIETGFIDLILARPLARHWIITRTIAVTALSTVAILIMMMLGTWLGLHALVPNNVGWPSRSLIFSMVLNLGLLMLCWSGIAMAIGSAARRRGVAGALAGLLALTTFLLDYVARAWQPAEAAGWLSPFRYFAPFDLLLGNPLPVKNLLVLAGIAVSGFLLSYILFSRRDISR
jgi:ABC-2 type transport system permease protein